MKWSQSDNKKFENAEPGSYAATCYRLIDLGTQETAFNGEKKSAHKVMIAWELSETMTDGRPFVVNSRFTVSLHEKATLRKFLAGWRGRDFNDEELKGFDAKNLLGKSCLLSLVQNGEYINVASASKLPKGMEGPKLVNPQVFFSLSEFDQSVYDSLSNGIKETIAKSPEYKMAVKGKDAFGDMKDSDLEEDISF